MVKASGWVDGEWIKGSLQYEIRQCRSHHADKGQFSRSRECRVGVGFGGVREFKGIYRMRLDHSAKCRASQKASFWRELFDGMKSVAIHDIMVTE
jgi:hypothetical protein